MKKKVQGRYHLLFLGDWDFYHDYVYVGNYFIDDEDMKALLNR